MAPDEPRDHAVGANPGWYPLADGSLRYWDGARWTERYATESGVPTAAPGSPLQDKRLWAIGGGIGCAVLTVLAMAAIAAVAAFTFAVMATHHEMRFPGPQSTTVPGAQQSQPGTDSTWREPPWFGATESP